MILLPDVPKDELQLPPEYQVLGIMERQPNHIQPPYADAAMPTWAMSSPWDKGTFVLFPLG